MIKNLFEKISSKVLNPRRTKIGMYFKSTLKIPAKSYNYSKVPTLDRKNLTNV